MLSSLIRKVLPGWRNVLLAVLSAVLLILAFPDFEWWFTAWFALVPLMWAIEREQGSTARSFALGWIFGTLFFFGTCWWLTFAPITYAGFPWPVAYFLMLTVSIIVGVFPAIFAAILSVLLRRFGSWAFLAAPFVWVFTEFLRYWLTGNNWNAIGYSQAFSWFEGSRLGAQVGGISVVGFMLVVCNCLIANAVVFKSRSIVEESPVDKTTPTQTMVSLTLGSYIYPILAIVILIGYLHDYGEGLERSKIPKRQLAAALLLSTALSIFVWAVGIMPAVSYGVFASRNNFVIGVQPNVPMSSINSSELARLRDRHLELAQSAFERDLERFVQNDFGIMDSVDDDSDRQFVIDKYARSPKLVILPESPMNFMYNDDREFQQFVREFTTRNNVSLIFNSAEPDATNGKYFNSAMMIGADGKVVAQYDKIYLLPFGEAVPVPLDAIVPGFVGNFSYGREYDLLPLGDAKAGVMICFESHFGQLSRRFVADGADVIIEMTNDGYLGPTPVLRQHLANAVFRAVETNRPVLRVTNVGITAYINERGQVLDPTAGYTEDTRVWSVSKSDGKQTFYVSYGDWFAWLCTVVTLLLIGVSVARRSVPIANSVTLPIDPNKFWGADYYHHPPLTEKMIGAGEKKLGVKLPEELIELLRVQNGGYTAGFVFPMDVRTSWACDHIPLSDLAGPVLDNDPETPMNLLDSAMLGKEWGVPERQILLSGDGHYWITLDYRKGERPTVAWIDTECGEDIQIASSFHEFLVGLIPVDEFDTAEDII